MTNHSSSFTYTVSGKCLRYMINITLASHPGIFSLSGRIQTILKVDETECSPDGFPCPVFLDKLTCFPQHILLFLNQCDSWFYHKQKIHSKDGHGGADVEMLNRAPSYLEVFNDTYVLYDPPRLPDRDYEAIDDHEKTSTERESHYYTFGIKEPVYDSKIPKYANEREFLSSWKPWTTAI